MTDPEREEIVEALNRGFEAIDRRFNTIDAKLASRDRQFGAVAGAIDGLNRRIDALEGYLERKFSEMLGHFDEVYRRLERVEQEYLMIVEALRRIEMTLLDERGQRELMERRLDELKREVTALQARIQQVEQRLQR